MSRLLVLAAVAATTFVAPVRGQEPDSTRPVMDARLRMEIALLSRFLHSAEVPAAHRFLLGDQEIAAGAERAGPVAVARGDLAVRGRITGDALVLHGDIVLHPGGVITGNAVAVDGRVRTLGGIAEGDVRSIRGITGGILARAAGRASETAPPTTWGAIKVVLGWFAVLCAMGIGVLLFAERNLDGVLAALDARFARAFWAGVLAQVAALPALLIVLVALTLSLIGILLVPFAVVAYVVALAGLVTLGFLAVARFSGRAFVGGATTQTRLTSLRSLFLGLVLFHLPWLVAAALIWHPLSGSIVRAMALAVTWVGVTFGLGAAILTRAGTRRDEEDARRAHAADDLAWQTPTPVTGVTAARRPVATVKEH